MFSSEKKILISLLLFCIGTSLYAKEILWGSKILYYSSQFSSTINSAEQALGKPSVMSDFGKSPCAWMPDPNSNLPEETLVIGFEKKIFVEQIILAENSYPGAVKKIYLSDSSNKEILVYEKSILESGKKFGRINGITINKTNFRSNKIKIIFQRFNELEPYQLDAVAISDTNLKYVNEINLAPESKFDNEPENLGANVNTRYPEIVPVISSDGKTLFFSRNKDPENFGDEKNEDIWVSQSNDSNKFEKAVHLGYPINNNYPNFAFSITPDGNSFLLGNVYLSDSTMESGVSISYNKGNSWGFPERVIIKNFNKKSLRVSYCLSSSGRYLISAIERNDSYGGQDIYVSFLEKDGTWSEPKNLGKKINTADDETTPFLAADDKTLYFSSAGICGYGSSDIFMSRRLDTSWTNWTEPQNLGQKINSPDWDAYYTIPASGDYAYFVSAYNTYGSEDIFRIKLPESLKPKPVVLVSGKVLNSVTGTPVEAIIKYELLSDGTEAGTARTNPLTGEYKIVLPGGENYGFLADAKGYIAINEHTDLTATKKYSELKKDLILVPIEKGQVIRLNNIFFEFGKFGLLQESFPELNRVIIFMKENPSVKIQINGHTDDVGSAGENLVLSRKRAGAVEDYLREKGISKLRLKKAGFGKSKPVADNNTEEGRLLNRRVEFIITNK